MSIPLLSLDWPEALDEIGPEEDPTILSPGAAQMAAHFSASWRYAYSPICASCPIISLKSIMIPVHLKRDSRISRSLPIPTIPAWSRLPAAPTRYG
jgi:hypothetical protein